MKYLFHNSKINRRLNLCQLHKQQMQHNSDVKSIFLNSFRIYLHVIPCVAF